MRKKILTIMIAAIVAISLMAPVHTIATDFMTNIGIGTVTVAAATKTAAKNGWRKEGGQWFYYKAGKVLTGWRKIGNKTYYFKKTGKKGVQGRMLTGWHKLSGKTFYFSKAKKDEGALKTGWQKINNKWFYFKKTGGNATKGAMLTGWQKLGGKNYYLKKTGANGVKGTMLTGWQTQSKKHFYFGGAGDGALRTGWQTISGKKYYFRPTGGKAVLGENFRSGTYTIDGKKHTFNAKGVLTNVQANAVATPVPDYINLKDPTDGRTYKVEPEILTDPQIGKDVSLEAFFAAVIYTEAGDQGTDGQLMVAMCIMNRVVSKDSYYPDSLKFVVYQDGQYMVARSTANKGTGTLNRELKLIKEKGYDWWKNSYKTKGQCATAAKTAFNKIEAWKKNPKANPRTINKTVTNLIKDANKKYGTKDTEFDHLFFMTPGAWERLNLSAKGCQQFEYKGHVFFRKWVRN